MRGNVQFAAGWVGTDRYYNQNELGYYNQQNNQRVYTRIRYQIFEEYKILRNYSNYLYMGQTWRYDNSRRTRNGFRFGNDFEFQNLYKIEFDLDYTGKVEDYYETRNIDRFLIVPSDFEVKIGLNSNPTKRFKFSFDFLNKGYKNEQFEEEKKYQRFNLNLDYRFSNNLSAKFSTQRDKTYDDIGYLMTLGENIYFGIRDQKTIENSIDIDYRIDNKKSINLNFRNFWSVADYDEVLFKLKDDGYREISDYALLESNPNTNFNIWNLDVKFQWWFSPGSNLIFLYRNQIFNRDNQSGLDYYKSLKNLFEIPIEHQISLRINYLIDANRFQEKMIVLKNISKTFGNQKILNNISLNISNGDFVSVVGPSGAGKTTLINIIGTIESFDLDQSSVLKIDGVEVNKLKEKEISKFRNENIGFVFQFHQLLPELNCEENILLPIRIGRKNINDYKEKLLSISKTLNIEKVLNKKPDFISGGEKQRVSFARALINNPKIVLADEPTGNLDSTNSKKIIELLKKINKEYGVTVIYVTHNKEFAKTASDSYTIKDGKCIKN